MSISNHFSVYIKFSAFFSLKYEFVEIKIKINLLFNETIVVNNLINL